MRRLIACCLATTVLSSCTPGEPASPPPEEVVVAVGRIGTIDPLTITAGAPSDDQALIQHQLYEGLTSYDPETLAPRPALASSWTVAPDAKTFTFTLRRGARFHDGAPVTAADVVASLDTLARTACEPPTSSRSGAPAFLLSAVVGYAEVAAACRDQHLAGIQAIGENTVGISLSQPFADLPAVLAAPALAILPADAEAANPPGTGPYRLAEASNDELVLERFADHWGDQPAIPRVRFVAYGDPALAYLDLLQDNVHHAPVPLNRAREARREFGEDGFVRGIGLYFLGMNLRSPKVAPLAFRRAISVAVDRAALASGIFEGTREAADGIASPAFPRFDEAVCGGLCDQDLEAARRGVREAYPDGPPDLVLGVSSEGSNPAVAEAVAGSLQEVGIRVRVLERPFTEHVRGMEEGDVDLFQFGWIPAYAAADGLLRPLFRSGSPDNYMGYADREVDALFDRARGTLEDAERGATYREAERRIIASAPVAPLLWYRTSVALDPRLRSDGPMVNPLGVTDFADLRFVEG